MRSLPMMLGMGLLAMGFAGSAGAQPLPAGTLPAGPLASGSMPPPRPGQYAPPPPGRGACTAALPCRSALRESFYYTPSGDKRYLTRH